MNRNNVNRLTVNQSAFQSSLRSKIKEIYGDVGSGEFGSNTMVRFFDAHYSNIMIIKTTRAGESAVRFALSCLTTTKQVDGNGSSKSQKNSFIVRTLKVNSCARTCLNSAKNIFAIFFASVELHELGLWEQRRKARGISAADIADEEKAGILDRIAQARKDVYNILDNNVDL